MYDFSLILLDLARSFSIKLLFIELILCNYIKKLTCYKILSNEVTIYK